MHLPAGFFLPNGYEFVMALLGGSVFLVLSGAGAYSVDAWLGGEREVRSQPELVAAERRVA